MPEPIQAFVNPIYGDDGKRKAMCYQCRHRRRLTHSAHSKCAKPESSVEGDRHGIANGWFAWPVNFDPIWLLHCTGYEARQSPDAEE